MRGASSPSCSYSVAEGVSATVVGLQQIHGKLLLLPRRPADRPDPKRLEQRYADFLRAS